MLSPNRFETKKRNFSQNLDNLENILEVRPFQSDKYKKKGSEKYCKTKTV